MKLRNYLIVALLSVVAAACGDGQSPVAPSSTQSSVSPKAPAPVVAPVAVLDVTGLVMPMNSIDAHALVGTPSLRVLETSGKSAAKLLAVEFLVDGGHAGGILSPINVPAGTTKLVYGPELQFSSTAASAIVTVVITYADDDGHQGTFTSATSVPIPPGGPAASLAITRFSVEGFSHGATFFYVPTFQVTEEGGQTGALITRVSFQLLDPTDRPMGLTLNSPRLVPPGGVLELGQPDVYGDPEFEIWGTGRSTRVQLVVSYSDDAGRIGSVTTVVDVSWSEQLTPGTK